MGFKEKAEMLEKTIRESLANDDFQYDPSLSKDGRDLALAVFRFLSGLTIGGMKLKVKGKADGSGMGKAVVCRRYIVGLGDEYGPGSTVDIDDNASLSVALVHWVSRFHQEKMNSLTYEFNDIGDYRQAAGECMKEYMRDLEHMELMLDDFRKTYGHLYDTCNDGYETTRTYEWNLRMATIQELVSEVVESYSKEFKCLPFRKGDKVQGIQGNERISTGVVSGVSSCGVTIEYGEDDGCVMSENDLMLIRIMSEIGKMDCLAGYLESKRKFGERI